MDREWDDLVAHREFPMISLDNNAAERMIRKPRPHQEECRQLRNEGSARLAVAIWTVTAITQLGSLNPLTYLTASLTNAAATGGKPPSDPALERFLPWNASPVDLRAWAQPPRPS